jgi:hypothetical protein
VGSRGGTLSNSCEAISDGSSRLAFHEGSHGHHQCQCQRLAGAAATKERRRTEQER